MLTVVFVTMPWAFAVDCRLRVLVAVVMLASAGHCFSPAISVNQSDDNVITMGESGVVCTKIKRRCLEGLQCINKECQCPPDQKGNGEIECVPKDKILCTVSADPHIVSYEKAKANMNLPCRYRLTRYVTAHRSARTRHSKCAVEVYATNELNKGQYYVASVDTSIGVTDSGQQVHHQFEVRKYGTSENKIYKYLSNTTKTRIVWGSSTHDNINGVDVYLTYDEINNFAVLDVPDCCTRIKYRAYDRKKHRQHLLPGLSIMAPKTDINWVDIYGYYQHSLCGTTNDTHRLYVNRAAALGVKNQHLAVIHDVLLERAPQADNPNKDSCMAAMKAFATSPNKAEHLNECGVVMDEVKVRRCLEDTDKPVDVFTSCILYKQNRHTRAHCNRLKKAEARCGLANFGISFSCP